MKSDEALDQIAFIKDILKRTRLSSAEGYPYYILWGVIWIVGYISSIWIPPYIWTGLCLIGGVGSYLIGRMHKWKATDMKLLKKLGLQSLILLVASFAIFALLVYSGQYGMIYALWPFEIGIIYMVVGVFMGKDLFGIGVGITLAALASLFIPAPFHFVWMALVGGGGLLLTGIIFRNQVKKGG